MIVHGLDAALLAAQLPPSPRYLAGSWEEGHHVLPSAWAAAVMAINLLEEGRPVAILEENAGVLWSPESDLWTVEVTRHHLDGRAPASLLLEPGTIQPAIYGSEALAAAAADAASMAVLWLEPDEARPPQFAEMLIGELPIPLIDSIPVTDGGRR